MNQRIIPFIGATICSLFTLINSASAQGTAFTYQGRLNNGTNATTGVYDVQFTLFTVSTSGAAVAGPVTNAAVGVTNGLFTTLVNFGNAFTGTSNWLELSVRTNGATSFTTLVPRQQLTPTPYAILASSVAGLNIQLNPQGAPNVLLGSSGNYISSGVLGGTISGGGVTNYGGLTYSNSITGNGSFGTVSGGAQNTVGGTEATVGGGFGNTAGNQYATVGGGLPNPASGSSATVAGGNSSTASGLNSAVGGGVANTASGNAATVPGGSANTASGDYSFAAGSHAQAANTGSFVWADSQNGTFSSTANNQFLIRAGGGVGIGTTTPKHTLDVNGNLFFGKQGNGQVFTELGDTLYLGSPRKYLGNTLGVPVDGSTDWINLMAHPLSQGIMFGLSGPSDTDPHSAPVPLMVIKSNGNVGIGATNPPTILTVRTGTGGYGFEHTDGNVRLDTYIDFTGGWLGTYSNHPLNFFVNNGFQSMTINTNGNVGIGTTTPATTLQVLGNVGIGSTVNASSELSIGQTGGQTQLELLKPGSNLGYQFATDSGGLGICEHNIACGRFYIQNATGNIGIGTTTPSGPLSVATSAGTLSIVPDTAVELVMKGGIADGALRVRNRIEMWAKTNLTQAGYLDVRDTNNNPVISLDGGNGNVTCVAINITSDRNAKEEFKPVNARDVLAKVARMPITEWQYKQQADARHIGPMAQDFRDAFTLGQDEKHISVVDEGGVALAAIQGLNEKVESGNEKAETQIQEIKAENAALKQTVNELKVLLQQLKQNMAGRKAE